MESAEKFIKVKNFSPETLGNKKIVRLINFPNTFQNYSEHSRNEKVIKISEILGKHKFSWPAEILRNKKILKYWIFQKPFNIPQNTREMKEILCQNIRKFSWIMNWYSINEKYSQNTRTHIHTLKFHQWHFFFFFVISRAVELFFSVYSTVALSQHSAPRK